MLNHFFLLQVLTCWVRALWSAYTEDRYHATAMKLPDPRHNGACLSVHYTITGAVINSLSPAKVNLIVRV